MCVLRLSGRKCQGGLKDHKDMVRPLPGPAVAENVLRRTTTPAAFEQIAKGIVKITFLQRVVPVLIIGSSQVRSVAKVSASPGCKLAPPAENPPPLENSLSFYAQKLLNYRFANQ